MALNTSVQIGTRAVIFNERLIVPRGERVKFSVLIGRSILPIEIAFRDSSDSPVSWTYQTPGGLLMWFSVLPHNTGPLVLKKPFKIGEIENETVGFTFELTAHQGIYVLQFIVMTGGDYDEQ
jgi:hypothetical protein